MKNKDFYTQNPFDVLVDPANANMQQPSEQAERIQYEAHAEGTGKQKRKAPVHIYMSDDLKARAKAAADLSDRSLSQWIIDAMRAHLEK